MRFAVLVLGIFLSFAAQAESHRYSGSKRPVELQTPPAIPALTGNYRVVEDLAKSGKKPPATIDLYWDTEHKCPVVRITDSEAKERKIILPTYDDTRAAGAHVASVKESTESAFRWVSKFNQASSIDNYLEVITTIELTRHEGKTEIKMTKSTVTTRYLANAKPQIDTVEESQHYSLELEKKR